MLKNYMDVNEEVKNRLNKLPKNNYFCHKWRVKDAFSKSIDREMFYQNVMGASQYKTLMNNKILSLYKSRYNRSRSDLIVDLAHKAMIFLEKRRYQKFTDSQTEVLLTNHTRGLVERVFNTLFAFTTELNSLLGLSELFVTATEPALTGQESGRATVDSKILARFSTNMFSLYIEGTKDRVQFYVLPADDLFLVDVSLEYEATCTWEATLLKNQQVQWHDKNGPVTDELLEITCVELLNQLLEKTKERLMPSKRVAEKKGANFEYNAPDPWEIDLQRTIESTTLILDAVLSPDQPEDWKQIVQASESAAFPPPTRSDISFSKTDPTSPPTTPSLNRTSERVPQSDVGTTTSWNHPVLESASSLNRAMTDSTTSLNRAMPDSTTSLKQPMPDPTVSAESYRESSYRWNGREYEVEFSPKEDVSLTDGDIETVAKGSPTKKTTSSKRRGSKRKRRR